jgi:translocation protein SEC66
MYQNDLLRRRVEDIQNQGKIEREWWNKKKADMQADLMKEINDGASSASGTTSSSHNRMGSDEDTVLVEAGGPADKTKKKKGKK